MSQCTLCPVRASQHNSNVSTPSKANNCMLFPEKQKFSRHKSLDPDLIHTCMCTCAQITYAHGPARICTASCFLPGMPSPAKTKLRGTKHEISPPLLSIECIRYLHSTLPFKPVVLSNSNVSHISILFPGIFFPW